MLLCAGGMIAASSIHAATHIISLRPITPTSVTIARDGTTTVQYVVTNESAKAHTARALHVPGVHQVSGDKNCADPFVLVSKASCVLTLEINGKERKGNIAGGPTICLDKNTAQCFQPAKANSLDIRLADH
jgi:hypothetical protein